MNVARDPADSLRLADTASSRRDDFGVIVAGAVVRLHVVMKQRMAERRTRVNPKLSSQAATLSGSRGNRG